jgi:hypothetical protein
MVESADWSPKEQEEECKLKGCSERREEVPV